jgi:hypothetical protein
MHPGFRMHLKILLYSYFLSKAYLPGPVNIKAIEITK